MSVSIFDAILKQKIFLFSDFGKKKQPQTAAQIQPIQQQQHPIGQQPNELDHAIAENWSLMLQLHVLQTQNANCSQPSEEQKKLGNWLIWIIFFELSFYN